MITSPSRDALAATTPSFNLFTVPLVRAADVTLTWFASERALTQSPVARLEENQIQLPFERAVFSDLFFLASSFFLLRWICPKDGRTIELISFNYFCKRFLAKTIGTRYDLNATEIFFNWAENDLPFFRNVPYPHTKFFLNIQCMYILVFKLKFACHFLARSSNTAHVSGRFFQPMQSVRKLASTFIC